MANDQRIKADSTQYRQKSSRSSPAACAAAPAGSYSGEVNALLPAGLRNDREVRAGLAERGLEIPADTPFIAGLHDTTIDAATLYASDADTSGHAADFGRLRWWLAAS